MIKRKKGSSNVINIKELVLFFLKPVTTTTISPVDWIQSAIFFFFFSI